MKRAFSLIEFIVVVGIVALFSSLTIPRFLTYNSQQKHRKEVRRLISIIESAKKRAVTGDLYQSCTNFQGYRVTLAANSFAMAFLCNGGSQQIQSESFDSGISATLGTGNYDFRPLGNNASIPSATIRLRNADLGQCIDISVSTIGIVSTNETLFGC